MPQTLTKPVLLDETGQDISSKINSVGGKLDSNGEAIIEALDDIKDAINTSSEFIPIRIKINTPPAKTSYYSGDALDMTGISVSLVASNGAEADVTSECTFSPANGATLTAANTSVTVSYNYQIGGVTFTAVQSITVRELSSISITTPPTKTAYKAGETLDLTGIAVMATFDDGSVMAVTNDCVFSPASGAALTTSDVSITVSYTSGSITKTTTQAISVKEVSSIAITSPPTKTNYLNLEQLDLTGMEVTATYTDGSTADVTSLCTYSPADGATLSTSNTTVTATFVESGLTKTATQAITVVMPIYGAEWDGTATTAWTRTDMAADFSDPNPYYAGMTGDPSSPFDTIYPWSQMIVVNDDDCGKLVRIPKFYYKLSQNGSSLKIQISATAQEGFSVSPAHMDRGDGNGERDVVYVGRYKCDGVDYKSITSLGPMVSIGRNTARTNIHNLGTDVWQFDFAMLFTIWLLYLVEFADWNSQAKIGYGCGTGSYVTNNGYTDSMPYHTGTTKTSRTAYGFGTQYRNIEGLWDNVYEWVDGCYNYSTSPNEGFNVILNPSDFADTANGVNIGIPVSGKTTALELKNIVGAFPMFLPSASGGSETTYTCDPWSYNSIRTGITHGWSYLNNQSAGMFTIMYNFADATDSNTGCRLMKLP